MKTTLDKHAFRREMRGASIDVKDGEKTALNQVDLQKADLDGDGKIAGAQETRQLFEAMDDHNVRDGFDTGNPRTLLLTADGVRTPAAEMLDIARDLAAESLCPPLSEGEKRNKLLGNIAKGMFALGLGALVAVPVLGLAPAGLLMLGSTALKLKSEQ